MNRNLPANPENRYAAVQWRVAPEMDAEENTPPISHHFWVLRRHRWKILGFIFACELATLIVSSRVTPIFESTG